MEGGDPAHGGLGGDRGDEYYRASRSELIDFFTDHCEAAGRALDVGCATGVLGAELLARGFGEVVGIEPVPEVAEKARVNLSSVQVGTFHDVYRGEIGTFDLVVFADSLEHMPDPWIVLAEARSLLNPGGALLLSVPNVSHWSVLLSLWKLGRWDYADRGLLDRTHLRFFTPISLAEALEAGVLRVLARMGVEKPLSRRYRWLRPLIAWLRPHLLVYQECVIAVPFERTVAPQ